MEYARAGVMGTFKVKQTQNEIELTGGNRPILYSVRGIDLPELTDMSFAVWHVLPFAMRDGADIHIDGPVDQMVLDNAQLMTRTWEMWRPREFRSLRITALPAQVNTNPRSGDLSMVSGGVDSTFMLLDRGRRETPSVGLQVQGMEYSFKANEQFERAMNHLQPLLDDLNYTRLTVRSNLAKLSRGYHSYSSVLAGYAFMFRSVFERAYFAADLTWEQDFVHFPWPLNHVTNRYFQGSDFSCIAVNEHVTRAEKVERIASDPLALSCISFCKDKDIRPKNCGKCIKCMRTKVLFAGMTGAVPAGVFLDDSPPKVTTKDIAGGEQAFIVDLYQRAKDKGYLDRVPGLEASMKSLQARAALRARIRRFIGK